MEKEILAIFDKIFDNHEQDLRGIREKVVALQAHYNKKVAELEAKVEDLGQLLAKVKIDHRPHTSRYSIDAGIGTIGFSVSGSIQLQELIEEFEACIKGNGVADTIRILSMSK